MRRICALCGRETDILIEGLCPDCYRKTHPLARVKRDFVGIVKCPVCGSINYKGRWVRNNEVIKKLILESVEFLGRVSDVNVEELSLNPGMNIVKVKLRGTVHELIPEYIETLPVSVRYTEELCPRCRDVVVEKERAILQIRSILPLSESLKNLVMSIIKNETARSADRGSIIGIDERVNGFDVKFTDQGLARTVAHKIHTTIPSRVSESQSVIKGRGDKVVTKLNISLTLAPISKGTIIMMSGKPYYILGFNQGTFSAINLVNRRYERLRVTDMIRSGVSIPSYEASCIEHDSHKALKVVIEGSEYVIDNAC